MSSTWLAPLSSLVLLACSPDGRWATTSMWVLSDPHVGSDLRLLDHRSLHDAVSDSLNGGDEGGESFSWDLAIVAGDYTGTGCPGDEGGMEIVEQMVDAGASPSDFYGLMGNHDAGRDDASWFERWIDPLGLNPGESGVDAAARPFPVEGTPERYAIEVGNVLVLMISDVNYGGPPFGRECDGGYTAGMVRRETWLWWVDQIETHPDAIIVTVSHQAPHDTTIFTSLGEGWAEGVHGCDSWADERGSSVIYAIDGVTIDGLDADREPSSGPADLFGHYLRTHPGAVDVWVHGHTHHGLYPGMELGGKADIARKYGVVFVNAGAVTRSHAAPEVPFSRLLELRNGESTMRVRTYLHADGWKRGEGFYNKVEEEIELGRPFRE